MGTATINLGGTLTRTARKNPGRLALVSHEREKITYHQLERLSNRFANGLMKLGARKGDHMAILFRNCNEQVIALFGVLKMGGTALLLNARLSANELGWILDHSDSSTLIFSDEFRQEVGLLRTGLNKVRHFIISGPTAEKNAVPWDQVLREDGDGLSRVEISGDDNAILMYTAGTTGKPKGVLLTHNSCIWNCVNWYDAGVYRPTDRSLQVMPIYHVAALGSVLTYVFIGGTCYLKRTFDPKDVMETIEREGITRWMAAPTVFNMILELPDADQYDTRSLTLLGSGGASIPGDTRKRVQELFPRARFFDTYGMTEASGGVTTLTPRFSSFKTGSVGKPYISEELLIVDENDQDMEANRVGEILFRGNNLMKGYYKNDETTSTALRGGWMHTGDLGRLDEDGFLYLVGRAGDLIITGGENVYPKEVEEVLYAHSGILEAAVIGVEDPKWGEAVKAVVVPRWEKGPSKEEVMEFCRKRIAHFKCPKSIDFVKELPKNQAGKILKTKLKESCRGKEV